MRLSGLKPAGKELSFWIERADFVRQYQKIESFFGFHKEIGLLSKFDSTAGMP